MTLPSAPSRALRTHASRALTALSVLFAAAQAQAAGFEVVPPGARDGGRAGASVVGADSALGLFYNPATLLAPTSRADMTVALQVHFASLCFTRRVVNEASDGDRSAGETFPKVCSDQGATLLPETAMAFRFGQKQRFAVALGTYVPPAATRNFEYGNSKTGTFVPSGSSTAIYTPSRYTLMSEQILQVFPTLGVAYEPHPQVRLGASFGSGITTFDFRSAAFSRVIVNQAFEAGAASDVAAHAKGADYFVPRLSAGIWAKPVRSLPLELGASFTWTQDVRTQSATLNIDGLHTDYYGSPLISGLLESTPQPSIHARVNHATVVIPQTALLAVGARYAQALAHPVDAAGDRLSRERFDVELDLTAALTSRVDAFTLDIAPTTITVPSPSALSGDISLALPERIAQTHRWKNQYGARLGGDYSVIPGRLGVRAGASYETSGVKAGYEQLDFLPVQRLGLSLGVTVRIVRYLDASLAFTHVVNKTHVVSINQAQLRRNVSGAPDKGDDQIVNAGRYAQTAEVLVAEVGARF